MITKAAALRALQFLRVIDQNDNLSITNIATVAMMIRLLMMPQLTVHDLGAFLAALVSYQVKRFAQPVNSPEDMSAVQNALAELQTKVTGLQLGQQTTRR